MRKFFAFVLPVCLIVVFQGSCGTDKEKHPDVSGLRVPYTAYPFYKDFSRLDTAHMASGLHQLKEKYPDFLDFYLDTLASLGVQHAYSDTLKNLKIFLTHKDYRGLFDTVNKVFTSTEKYDEQLKRLFQHIKYYDSLFIIPERVYYFASGLNLFTAVTHGDKDLGIGLDMFLGRAFAPYASIGIAEFATIRFTPENIPVWAARAIYQNNHTFFPEDKTLIEMMIEKGKELYFLEKVLPDVADSLKLGFTGAQLKWCLENEGMMYHFFIQNNLLYEKNMQKIMRFVDDGPNTAGMPPESPGNTGSFVGLQIVRQYAQKTGASLPQILAETDAQKILEKARYKPL